MPDLHFKIIPIETKYCIYCPYHTECAINKMCVDYAKECERYKIGPGWTQDDEIYKRIRNDLIANFTTPDSELRRQLREIFKLEI